MSKAILNARVYLAEIDLSGVANAAALNLKTDLVECTAFSDAYKDRLAGMTDVIADISGYFSAEAVTGNPDHKLFDQLGLHDAALTLLPDAAGAFDTMAYFFRPLLSEYSPLEGKVGDMATFKLHAEGADPLVRGRVFVAKAAKTVTGSGTKINLGAYSATQKLYAVLHVFAASGTPTLDAAIAIADRIATVQVHPDAKGSGYSTNDILTVVQSGGSLGTLKVESTGGGGSVETLSVVTSGSGYAVADELATTVAPPGGTGAKIDLLSITDTPVLAFAQKTGVGHEWKTDDGPITDVNFKATYTIGGGTPSITFAIVAGIV
jgi:hypothetical protein